MKNWEIPERKVPIAYIHNQLSLQPNIQYNIIQNKPSPTSILIHLLKRSTIFSIIAMTSLRNLISTQKWENPNSNDIFVSTHPVAYTIENQMTNFGLRKFALLKGKH